MADAWFAPLPRCPEHGQMSRRSETRPLSGGMSLITRTEWICHGWDGEGCDHRVPDEDLDWQPLGEAEIRGIRLTQHGRDQDG
jgi:hypothetical protein